MSVSIHPNFDSIKKLIEQSRSELQRGWSEPVYRCVTLEFAKPGALIGGEGSFEYGNRWIAPHVAKLISLATTDVTAVVESRQQFSRYGISKRLPDARALIAVHARLSRTLDLTLLDLLKSGFLLSELLSEEWEEMNSRKVEGLAQAFGRAAYQLGYEAILAPSARVLGGQNLMVFPENLLKESRFEVHDHKRVEQCLK